MSTGQAGWHQVLSGLSRAFGGLEALNRPREYLGAAAVSRSTSAFNRAMHGATDTEPSQLAPLPRQRPLGLRGAGSLLVRRLGDGSSLVVAAVRIQYALETDWLAGAGGFELAHLDSKVAL